MASHNTDLLSYNSGGQKSEMSLNKAKIKVSEENPFPCLFELWVTAVFLGLWPLSPSLKHIISVCTCHHITFSSAWFHSLSHPYVCVVYNPGQTLLKIHKLNTSAIAIKGNIVGGPLFSLLQFDLVDYLKWSWGTPSPLRFPDHILGTAIAEEARAWHLWVHTT